MRISTPLMAAALALPLAACATSPYGTGYGNNNPLGTILGSIGTMGGAYSPYGYGASAGNFQQAAVNACAGTAARYGQVRITQVRQISASSMKVWGNVYGFRNDSWDCTFRSDGRITDFDI